MFILAFGQLWFVGNDGQFQPVNYVPCDSKASDIIALILLVVNSCFNEHFSLQHTKSSFYSIVNLFSHYLAVVDNNKVGLKKKEKIIQ